VLVFDAAGLALFAVSGASKALAFDVGPVGAMLLGILTGIGGGIVRDVLVSEIPTVLRTELYAVAALIGAAVVVIGAMLHVPSFVAALAGAALCFGLGSWPCDEAGNSRSRACHSNRINKTALVAAGRWQPSGKRKGLAVAPTVDAAR
jgi:ABC-type xylose transport system permease subunit